MTHIPSRRRFLPIGALAVATVIALSQAHVSPEKLRTQTGDTTQERATREQSSQPTFYRNGDPVPMRLRDEPPAPERTLFDQETSSQSSAASTSSSGTGETQTGTVPSARTETETGTGSATATGSAAAPDDEAAEETRGAAPKRGILGRIFFGGSLYLIITIVILAAGGTAGYFLYLKRQHSPVPANNEKPQPQTTTKEGMVEESSPRLEQALQEIEEENANTEE